MMRFSRSLGKLQHLKPKSGLSVFNFSSSLHNKRDHEANRSGDRSTSWMTEKDRDFRITTQQQPLQFSKKPILDNFGELQPGEIPEPLKYVHPFRMTVLDNGIRVCTESWDSNVVAIGAFIDAGSRYETVETTGTSHFLEHLLFKGSKGRSKSSFENEVENMGATVDAYTSREHTLFNMQCFPGDVKKAVNILADMLQNPSLSKADIEAERDTIKTELEESNKDTQETIMEGVHFNCYRDHMIGQPILGDIDNIDNVTQDMVKQYHSTHYVGKNIVIVGTGKVNHEEFVQTVNDHFGKLNKNSPEGLEKANTDKPLYTPSCMFMRDDQLYNAGIGVFYDAPSWFHEDYYACLLLERIIGHYNLEKNGPTHLNDHFKQYSTLEAYCGALPDVTKATTIFSPYRDCGLFGTYFYGNEVFARYMTYAGIYIPAHYGHDMNMVEVYRGRARLWQELLNIQSPADVMQLIGPQILYLNRRVSRAEIAKRVSYFDNNNLRKIARHWFYDAEPSIVAYGPVESLAMCTSYSYYKINNYCTTLNLTHSLV